MNNKSVFGILPADVDKMSLKQRHKLLSTYAMLLQQHQIGLVDIQIVHRLLLLRGTYVKVK